MNTAVNQQLFQQLPEDDQARLLAMIAQKRSAAGLNGHGPGTALVPIDAHLGLNIQPLADLLAQEFTPLQFLVGGLIAKGHLCMLGGRPKSGKSWLTLQLAQAIDQARPFLGRETKHGRVLLIALEDGQRRVYQRCNVLRWQPRNTAVCFDIAHFNGDGKTVDVGPGLKQLEAAAADYDLVIVDTLIAALNGRANENDNTSMGAVVNELARIAHDTETAVLLVHHTGKGNAENVFDLLRGASALRGGYDVGMVLSRKQEEREAILHVESRDFDAESLTIRQAESGAGWECLGNGRVLEEVRAGRKVIKVLSDHGDGLTAEEVGKLLGTSRVAAYRQLCKAERDGYVYRKSEEITEGRPADLWYLANHGGGINI